MSPECYCGKNAPYSECCEPIIKKQIKAPNAEALMRSRYSAYATSQFQYILDTYSVKQRQALTLSQLAADAEDTRWIKLVVENSVDEKTTASVIFSAYYQYKSSFYKLHENSEFVIEDGEWRYVSGEIFDDSGLLKPQRNAPCICGSGLKFKRCCGK